MDGEEESRRKKRRVLLLLDIHNVRYLHRQVNKKGFRLYNRRNPLYMGFYGIIRSPWK